MTENSADNPVIGEAKSRFERAMTWEHDSRRLFLEDTRFAHGDSDNKWQWPDDIRKDREASSKPILTINKVRQHNLLILNDARQNKTGVKIRPAGGGATAESAQALTSLVRYIEYHSNAQDAYETAMNFQINGGIGYWRLVTDYIEDDSFDQDIFIRRIMDPLAVLLDPDIKELDGSDALFGFIYDDMPKEEYTRRYKDQNPPQGSALGTDDFWFQGEDKVRRMEYFRVKIETDTLLLRPDNTTIKKSLVHSPELWKELTGELGAKTREIETRKVEWYFIAGGKIIDQKDWPGKFVPIVRVVGEEVVIEGKLDRKGHTRAMKDPQRMYNYWSAAAVEYGALQSKTPYIGPAKAFEGHEGIWKNSNIENYPYLPYNHLDDGGETKIPPPTRQEPPVAAPVALSGMQIAEQEIMRTSGQFEAQLGERGNERSGKAITERQRQGDNATFHYINNLGVAIRHTGRIILDLVPHIYDTERLLEVIAEDGTTFALKIDPDQQETFQAQRDHDQEIVQRVLNPKLGRYQVQADIGPAYATKRDEAFEAFATILTQAPDLVSVIGDILFRAADFPLAEEAAQRLRRMVPREALGLGPTQAEQEMQQRVEQLTGMLQAMMDELGKEKAKSARAREKFQVDAYNALTKRLDVLSKQQMDEAQMRLAVAELFKDVLGLELDFEQREADRQMELRLEEPPVEGAKKAPDGNWYVDNPDRPGQFMQVRPNGNGSGASR